MQIISQRLFGINSKFPQQNIEIITKILGIDKINHVIIVGHGKMGEMISSNLDVLGEGFKIVGIFDKDKNKIRTIRNKKATPFRFLLYWGEVGSGN